jgi:hypothetical protein
MSLAFKAKAKTGEIVLLSFVSKHYFIGWLVRQSSVFWII